jgi:hypothetical protein
VGYTTATAGGREPQSPSRTCSGIGKKNSEAQPASYCIGTGYYIPETERPVREADGLSPSDKDKEWVELYLQPVISRRGGNGDKFYL